MKNLAVLVSGGGTNMQAVLGAIDRGEIDGRVVVVISSNAGAYALTRAAERSIPHFVCAKQDFVSAEKRDRRILELLKEYAADYVLLAGYLGILSREIIAAYPYRIVNIHPALLPRYGGKSYFGINVHRAVIAAREPFSGATVHFVDEGTDTGLIIRQEKLAVLPDDTPESLQKRILENIEHKLFVSVVADLCAGRIRVQDGRVETDEKSE